MNQLSPIRSPMKRSSSSLEPPMTPPQWKKPDDVMKLHRLRLRKNALTARMNGCVSPSAAIKAPSPKKSPQNAVKRKNPFRRIDVTSTSPVAKKIKEVTKEEKHDESLFQLLGLNQSQAPRDFSFLNVTLPTDDLKEEEQQKETISELPVDWALRTKLRFISSKQFPWTETLKTCEEASGITGFVRCVESGGGGCIGLDTSPNANFHQCCMYWQHPNLSWLDLFPRTRMKKSVITDIPVLTAYPHIKDSLHRDWSESYRSLFQLLRARHCPYFYMISNNFTCIFRAAGINGCSETTALVCPTTQGFRKLLSEEGIEYSMPLRVKTQRVSQEVDEDDQEVDDEENEKLGGTVQWLTSLGIAPEEIQNIKKSQEMQSLKTDKKIDGNEESLIYITGCEVHALFNFLLNCRSIIALTGPLTGIPPTLLSPIAFSGGSLLSLKVRHSIVKLDNEAYHSLEMIGPILPHSIHNLCNILEKSVDNFSVTFANIDLTKAFTSATIRQELREENNSPSKVDKAGQVFCIESLNDCGLKPRVLSRFCSENVEHFDSLKFSKGLYMTA